MRALSMIDLYVCASGTLCRTRRLSVTLLLTVIVNLMVYHARAWLKPACNLSAHVQRTCAWLLLQMLQCVCATLVTLVT